MAAKNQTDEQAQAETDEQAAARVAAEVAALRAEDAAAEAEAAREAHRARVRATTYIVGGRRVNAWGDEVDEDGQVVRFNDAVPEYERRADTRVVE